MVLVSELLVSIGWTYSPLNLANMKIPKTREFVRNTGTTGNRIKKGFKYHAQPQTGYWRIFLFIVYSCKQEYIWKCKVSVIESANAQ